MKKFRLITALVLVLLMTVGNPLTAVAASWDVTDSDGVFNAFATDTDAEVIINMQNDINMDTGLVANEGQNYVINGNGNTISDVILSGEGSVDINADVTGEENYAALEVYGQTDVSVTGDVTGEYSGIYAGEGSTVTVEGDVTAEDGAAISAYGSDVTVTGDVTGEYAGIYADEGSTVTVEGNVTSNEGSAIVTFAPSEETPEETPEEAPEAAVVTVDGNVTANNGTAIHAMDGTVEVTGDVSGFTGISASGDAVVNVTGDVSGIDAANSEMNLIGIAIEAYESAKITVDGNVSGGDGYLTEEEMQNPEGYSDGGTAIFAAGEAVVTVTGDVAGGDSMGTFSYGGTGINATEEATVTVEGNVTGGDAIADPAVAAKAEEVIIDAEGNTESYYPWVSKGGNAVVANYGATVTVGGNVTGGSTNGDHGNGGHGIELQNHTMGEEEWLATGSVTVKGTVSGGAGSANGKGGAAVYYSTMYGYLPGEDLEEILNTPAKDLTDNQINILSQALNKLMMNGDLTDEEFSEYLSEIANQLTEDMTEEELVLLQVELFQKIISKEASDLDSLVEEFPEYAKVTVGTLSDKNGPAVNSDAGVESAEQYAKTNVTETAPSTGSNPKTGDDFNGMLLVTLMALSLLGVGVLLTQRKRFV